MSNWHRALRGYETLQITVPSGRAKCSRLAEIVFETNDPKAHSG